ncbi:hypothetical protein D3C81_1824530 [compost metagenome]
MRHHQADKGDRADNRGRASAQDGDYQQTDKLRTGDFTAQRGGGIRAQAQTVQTTAEEQGYGSGDQYWDQDHFQGLQTANVQRTGLPETQLIVDVRVEQGDAAG